MLKQQEELLIKLTELGHELEGVIYNDKFVGQGGIDKATLRKERASVRNKAKRVIAKLQEMGIDPFTLDFTYEDENGIEWELDYAIQFI